MDWEPTPGMGPHQVRRARWVSEEEDERKNEDLRLRCGAWAT